MGASLRARFATVSVEAGANTARALYDAPCLVDELLLGRFLGRGLDAEARGEPFLEDSALARALGPRRSECIVEETSGTWAFARYVRPAD